MRLRPLAPTLTLLALCVPVAHAQDAPAGFDAAAAVRGFVTNAALFHAASATVGDVTTTGDTVRASNVAMAWSFALGSADAPATFTASITVPTLDVDSLAPDGERWTVAGIAIPSVKISVGVAENDTHFAYDLTAHDYHLTDASWPKLPTIADNPAAPVSRFAPLLDWSVGQSYAKAEIGGIDGTMTTPQGEQKMSYGPITVGPVENGVAASFSYGESHSTQTMDLPSQDPDAEPGTTVPTTFVMTQGGSHGEHIDSRALNQLLTGKGDATGPVPLIGTIAIDKTTLGFGDVANVDIGPSVLEGVTVDPTRGPILTALDSIVVAAKNGDEPQPEDVIGLVLDLYGALGIERYSLASVDGSFTGGHVKMGEVSIEGLSAAGLDHFGMGGVDVAAEGTTARLGSFEIGDVAFPARDAFMQMIMGSMAGMQPNVETILTAMPLVGRVAVSDVAFANPALGDVALGSFETRLENFVNGIPTRNAISLAGLHVPASLITDPTAQMILQALNLGEIAGDAKLTLGWDEDSQRVELDNDVAVAGVGQLTASAAVGGIPAAVIEDPTRAQEAVATASLVGLSASFADAGLTNALLDLVAAQSGVSKADFVQGITSQVSMQVAMLTGDSALGQQISTALATFLGDPRSLRVELAPANPVPVAQVMGAAMTAPQTLSGLLNFSISANQ